MYIRREESFPRLPLIGERVAISGMASNRCVAHRMPRADTAWAGRKEAGPAANSATVSLISIPVFLWRHLSRRSSCILETRLEKAIFQFLPFFGLEDGVVFRQAQVCCTCWFVGQIVPVTRVSEEVCGGQHAFRPGAPACPIVAQMEGVTCLHDLWCQSPLLFLLLGHRSPVNPE